jgi:pimeloyl-ACP methyl ester carboxylesterase
VRIEPFRVSVPDTELAALRARIGATRWPAWPEGASSSEGPDVAWLRQLAAHWADGFDWRSHEACLNRCSQFRADIDGTGIHFIHERGEVAGAFPLLITHGWPGSVLEMLELIPRLTHPSRFGGNPADAFDVVVPSLPGYGFSDQPPRAGMDPAAIAGCFLRLMEGLGYARFGAQGGDWGATVATRMALAAPDRMAGIHLNYLPGSYRPSLEGAGSLTQPEREFLSACERWGESDGAYAHLQRTTPLTVAYALHDSPVGLAAWIGEKVVGWSDTSRGGGITADHLLAAVTLYWLTGTIGSSMRLYREAAAHPLRLGPGERVAVPAGFALFPAETPANPPRAWVERGYDVLRWQEMPRGGHFAAWEEPDLLAGEIRAFFRQVRPY